MRLSSEVRAHARDLIARRLGLDFPERRDDELERRLLRACKSAGAADAARYVALLEPLPESSREWKQLASYLTVGETYFFRDRACFDALEHGVIPALIERRRREGTRRLRLWSAGCATGEEPYSLAMLLDGLLPDRAEWSVTILATDLDPVALTMARRAVYRDWSLRGTSESLRRRFFVQTQAGFELAPAIRRTVTFAPLNLAEDLYPSLVTNTSAMDVVLCRNVVMYFTEDARRATVDRLWRALVPGGWLVLAPAEASSDLLGRMEAVSFPGAMLFRNAPDSRPRHPARTQPGARSPMCMPDRRRPSGAARPTQQAGRPRETASLRERAQAEAGRGNLEQATDLCRAALAEDRLDPEAHLLLAAIWQERGEIVAALEALRSAIYVSSDSAAAHFLLGSLLLRQGETGKGRRSMETVVTLLGSAPPDDLVVGAEGLTAGRLLETARAHLEAR